MPLTGTRTYVGFGFGAIQAGLFLYEAYHSGNFGRLVVAEILPEMVSDLRLAEGYYSVNIAYPDRVESARVGPVEIYDPARPSDRDLLVGAVAEAEEIGTAIPSATNYRSKGPGSLDSLLTRGLRRKAACAGPGAIVYTAENHNHAAEILEEAVLDAVPAAERDATCHGVQFLNTVIGKMSGVISGADAIREHGLETITPHGQRAFLVEAFNRISISEVQSFGSDDMPPFRRGIGVFEEQQDLLPFEEAKLYGHNATHALGAYVGALVGVRRFADLSAMPGILAFLRAAFVEESGEALVRKHAGVDRLFTREGYAAYADDLLARMTNPHLLDTIERVGRDPERKLGWNDRLVGTMRVALAQGVEPRRYAFGAAAALAMLDRSITEQHHKAEGLLDAIWREAPHPQSERDAVLNRIRTALHELTTWCDSGFGYLEHLFRRVPGV